MYQICRPYFYLSLLFMKREHLLTVLARVVTIVTLITPITLCTLVTLVILITLVTLVQSGPWVRHAKYILVELPVPIFYERDLLLKEPPF